MSLQGRKQELPIPKYVSKIVPYLCSCLCDTILELYFRRLKKSIKVLEEL